MNQNAWKNKLSWYDKGDDEKVENKSPVVTFKEEGIDKKKDDEEKKSIDDIESNLEDTKWGQECNRTLKERIQNLESIIALPTSQSRVT